MPTCTPAALADAAKTFQGLSPEQKQSIDTYLLAVIAGGSTDPNTLALAAKCFQCIPPGELKRVQAYLLCQIASGGGGSSQDLKVAWTPTSDNPGQLMAFCLSDDTAITTLTFSGTQVGGIYITNCSSLTSVSAPVLTGGFQESPAGGLVIAANNAMTTCSFPELISVDHDDVKVNSNAILTTFSLPKFTTVYGVFEAKDNPLMTSFSAPLWVPQDGSDSNFSGDALPAAQVNNILHRHVLAATWGTSGETLLINGGTNAAPTGQGIVDKGLLIGRGATVTTN